MDKMDPELMTNLSKLSINNLDTLESCIHSISMTCNWLIANDRRELKKTLSVCFATDDTGSMALQDIVDENRCIELTPKSSDKEVCSIEIKLLNGYRIQSIGIVSEASVLEIFRENEEYAFTTRAELIDEFEDSSVYYAVMKFDPPTQETILRLTRVKNNRPTIYIYGIKLLLDVSKNMNTPELPLNSLINFISHNQSLGRQFNQQNSAFNQINQACQKNNVLTSNANENLANSATSNNDINENRDSSILSLVDLKLKEMESRICYKISLMEAKTDQRLEEIKNLLELLIENKKNVNDK